MGVEDFRQQDQDRDISAVRNFYAGILLLAKEALIRKAPNADPELVIGAKLRPVPDGSGGIAMEQVGHTTIDFQQISERAKSFGVALDPGALKKLNRIRNDIEHHYTSESSVAIREAISMGFPVVASLFRELDEEPASHLGESWAIMLATKEFYDEELRDARATLSAVQWYSGAIANADLICPECRSKLVGQLDPENEFQDHVEPQCRTCGKLPDLADVIECTLDDLFGADAYLRAKEEGIDGPLYDCPSCGRTTLLEYESTCANCNDGLDFERKCYRCAADITVSDYLDGLDRGLCSYCSYVEEKVMRDD